ncbi:MAG: MmcQ/YjbR family DNA-binding protein [Ruminiclostridium sp.]|nr:MmcQ/YjbR family DNA-binding protein [Ruminiclostridium sp.]
MMTRKEVVAACLEFPFAYEDYPFDDHNWTVMRHQGNKKIFAAIFQREGRIWINVKAEPLAGDFWRRAYPAVIPAYHMNKTHWVSMILDGTMTEQDILRLIRDSYDLTAPKRKGGPKQKNPPPDGEERET